MAATAEAAAAEAQRVTVAVCCEDVVNGCGWVRPKETAREEEKEIYKVKGFSADTMFVELPLVSCSV